jgi:Phosphodiester glycosidase
MTLSVFADLLVGLRAHAALNLDGGSAGVVVSDGRRVNVPRDDEGNDMESSSPSVTALVSDRRPLTRRPALDPRSPLNREREPTNTRQP